MDVRINKYTGNVHIIMTLRAIPSAKECDG